MRLSLFGIITITAPYLPYALCLFSWALSGGGGPGSGPGWGLGVIVSDLLGIAAGHWWCVAVLSPSPSPLFLLWGVRRAVPRAPQASGRTLLQWARLLCAVPHAHSIDEPLERHTGTSGLRFGRESARRVGATGSRRRGSCACPAPSARGASSLRRADPHTPCCAAIPHSVKLLDPPARLEELEAADRARAELARQHEADRVAGVLAAARSAPAAG